MNPEDLSLVEAAAAIRSGDLSPYEYAMALLARLDRIEDRVRAWVTVDRPALLSEARKCEAEARERRFRGPLHGIPIGIKDIFYTKGLKTTMGSPVFANFVPDFDADAVSRLKQAGAVVLGKCVTTMFANLDPPPTRNPWNIAHTPGGSSSGSAAAVAARMCPAAIGSQTLGSVGRPAAFNGIVSLVPGQNRVSLRGVFPLAWSLDHVGMFGRSVADVELMLYALTESRVEKVPIGRAIRIGMVGGYFYDNATSEVRSLNDALAQKLIGDGFQVEEARVPPFFAYAQAALRTIVRAEAASAHEHLFKQHRDTYAPKIRALVETGMLVDAAAYLRARRIRRKYQREMVRLFDEFDLLMTPAAPGTAPDLTSTGDPGMNSPWTFADFPVLTLPHALGANGLPVAVQFCAAPSQEVLLLEAAKAVESIIHFDSKPQV